MTTPEKSRPGVRGNVVPENRPATFFTSLGLIAAAFTLTSASPSRGSGRGISSIRRTDGTPNLLKRKAFMQSSTHRFSNLVVFISHVCHHFFLKFPKIVISENSKFFVRLLRRHCFYLN